MADMRCQMCGKTNPDDLDECQFCGARLKPLIKPSPSDQNQLWGNSEKDEDVPDWLRELRKDEKDSGGETFGDLGGDVFSGQPAPEEESEEIDWLSRIGGHEDDQTQPESDESGDEMEFPDWLSVASGGVPTAKTEMQEEPHEEGDLDWLKRVRERQMEDSIEENIDELPFGEQLPSSAQGDEIPDWLSSAAFTAGEAVEEEPSDLPDWLSGSQAPLSPFVPDDEDAASIKPDWMTQAGGEEQLEQELSQEPVSEEGLIAEEELSDWFSGINIGQEELPAAEPTEMPTSAYSFSQEEVEAPDWLSNFNAAAEELPPAAESQVFGVDAASLFGGEALPGGLEPEELPEAPDWLAGVSAAAQEGQLPEPSRPESEPPPDLARASLPEWLEAMRPVESGMSSEPFAGSPDDRVEGAGPLAGLRGVLQAEPDIARVRKPPAYSVKLQVPEEQQNQLAMLQGLIASESKPKPLPSPAMVSVPYVLRLVIFSILILAVIWALITGGQQALGTGDAQDFPELLAFRQTIESLSPDPIALVAVDYEPGFSGELDLAAKSVLSHLVSKNAQLALVSSTSNGPVMAERLVQLVNQKLKLSNNIVYHTNLGYIPGGAAGVLSFALAPQKVIQYDLNGDIVWQNNPLQGQKGLDNFSLTLVITDNPDTARLWIEQVGPILQEKRIPLLMVLSAQAEPLVLPYHSSYLKQVGGIVTGLRGGVLYESLSDQNEIPWKQWGAYSLTLLLSVLLVLVGGTVNIFSALIEQSKKSKSEGKT